MSINTRLLAPIMAAALAWIAPARADAILNTGSNFTVTATDAPTNYTDSGGVLGGTSLIAGGTIQVSQTVTVLNNYQEWVVFGFSTVGGGAFVGSSAATFSVAVSGIQTVAPTVESNVFAWFATNGTPSPSITAGSGFFVETNPITGSGQVFDFGNGSSSLNQSHSLNIRANPASFLGTRGVDIANVNQFYIGGLLTVPEPASLTLFGFGAFGLAALRRRRREAQCAV